MNFIRVKIRLDSINPKLRVDDNTISTQCSRFRIANIEGMTMTMTSPLEGQGPPTSGRASSVYITKISSDAVST
jgi:hypothetical protein